MEPWGGTENNSLVVQFLTFVSLVAAVKMILLLKKLHRKQLSKSQTENSSPAYIYTYIHTRSLSLSLFLFAFSCTFTFLWLYLIFLSTLSLLSDFECLSLSLSRCFILSFGLFLDCSCFSFHVCLSIMWPFLSVCLPYLSRLFLISRSAFATLSEKSWDGLWSA